MSLMDPIADMLTRIRNARMARHTSVTMPYSKIKAAIAKILVDNGFAASLKVEGESPKQILFIQLETMERELTALERVSKPGRRVYVKADEIPKVLSGRGIVIMSTPGGIMTGMEARKKRLGGELICKVW